MAIRFVNPEPVTIPLTDGESITVKNRLTHGEHDEMMSSIAPHVTPGQALQIESKGIRAAKVAAYLLGWSASLPYSAGMPLKDRVDTLNNLETDAFDDIERAIDAHIAATSRESMRKNDRVGVPSSAQTSTSAGR